MGISAIEIKAQKKYKRKAIVGSVLFTLFLVLLFFLVGFTEPDPLPVDIEEVQEIELGGVDIKFDAPAAGGGSPANSDNPNPTPETSLDTPSQEESEVHITKGDGKQDKPVNNKPKIDEGLGFPNGLGDGGDGGGQGGGHGSGIGSGSDGYGDGNGGGGNRSIVKGICGNSYQGIPPGKIYLKLHVDASGKVIGATNISSKSSTGDKRTIDAAKKEAKCIKFEARPGTGTQTIELKDPIHIVSN